MMQPGLQQVMCVRSARPMAPQPHLKEILFSSAIEPTDIASSMITRPSYLASVTSQRPASNRAVTATVATGVHISAYSKTPLQHFGKLACVVLTTRSIQAIQSFCLQCKCGQQTVHIICVHRHYIATVFTHPFGPCAVASITDQPGMMIASTIKACWALHATL